MKKRLIIGIFVLISILILSVFVQAGITGKVIIDGSTSCTEIGDEGYDIFTSGKYNFVNSNGVSKFRKDKCFENQLKEYRCSTNGELEYEMFTCDTGCNSLTGACNQVTCNNGDDKCEEKTSYKCELNEWVSKGMVIGSCGVNCLVNDDCLSNQVCSDTYECISVNIECNGNDDCSSVESEIYCDGSNICSKIIESTCQYPGTRNAECAVEEPIINCEQCAYGCDDNQCNNAPEPICVDSDGGKDFFVKGEIYVNEEYHNEDQCNPAEKEILNEWYCGEERQNVDSYFCSLGCSDGACNSPLIHEDIGELKYDGADEGREFCDFMETGDCLLFSVQYDDPEGRVDDTGASVEIHKEGFSNLDFVLWIKSIEDENMILEERTSNGKNYYQFSEEGDDDIFAIWHSEGKIIFIRSGGEEIEAEKIVEVLIGKYMEKHPSELVFEEIKECQILLDKVKNPKDFYEGGTKFSLSWNNSYETEWYINNRDEKGTEYHASWRTDYDGINHYISYNIMVFENKNIDLSEFIEQRTRYNVCKVRDFYDIDGNRNNIYVCNWDALRGEQNLDNNQYKSRQLFWIRDNNAIEINTYSNKWISDKEVLKLGQEQIIDFLNDLKNNQGKYVGWEEFEIMYPLSRVVENDLLTCGSDIPLDTCNPSWNCKTEPAICPPHGYQIKTCTNYGCGEEDQREERLYCSPGICAGCSVPQWLYSRESKCIPYGFRVEQETGDFVEKIREYSDEERLQEGELGRDISLVIESENKAILTVYIYDRATEEEIPYEYVLIPGKEVSLDAIAELEDEIEIIIATDKIVISDIEGESYVDVTIKSKRLGIEYLTLPMYCDIDGVMKAQKLREPSGDWAKCQNNYECESNICSSGECIEVVDMLESVSAFRSIGTRILCKLAHIFNQDNYNQCIFNFLGEEA